MQWEQRLTNKFLFCQLLFLGSIFDAEYSYFKILLFFESVLDVEVFGPRWVYTVFYNLRHPKDAPFATNLLAQDRHSISLGIHVHVRQIDATDWQSEVLG